MNMKTILIALLFIITTSVSGMPNQPNIHEMEFPLSEKETQQINENHETCSWDAMLASKVVFSKGKVGPHHFAVQIMKIEQYYGKEFPIVDLINVMDIVTLGDSLPHHITPTQYGNYIYKRCMVLEALFVDD